MQRSRTQLVESEGKIYLVTELDQKPNLDHVETVSGTRDQFYMDWEIADTRKARPQQRRLFFALLNDIMDWSVTPQDYLKSLFYLQYQIYTDGKQISLSDVTTSSVSDANQLLDLVIDFMFEWRVPFKKGYELLPRDQEYYLFECCRHRVCMICGNRADIHHVDVIGAGMNRTHVDHTKRHVMSVCRRHHSELEQIGAPAFSAKYHVPVDGIKLDVETLKRIGLKGNYSSD
ncbi:putative HNHc nuclease [Lactiplantibacillus sp. WILCCON 0030]|uniref:HNHc nuclease n=1 Tax=Lactiplantibacillus brownii TaxID=3069269 RepID=A0ABU1A812_9LACO|nr:putative HNHc nuclease [Lactiplantibacillus brownii]MDQ7937075.1 putative HNHc nuclease [Lactiplantibacillus brownii]